MYANNQIQIKIDQIENYDARKPSMIIDQET
jgi:hypothetical protein